MADDLIPELPAALRIPQDQRREAWKGRKLTRPTETPAQRSATQDPGTARLMAELDAKAKAAAKAKKAAIKEAKIIRARQRVPSQPKQETDMAKKATKTTRKTAPKSKTRAAKPRPAKKGAASKQRGPSSAPAETKAVRSGSKLETILGLLQRPEGCTTAQVKEATGWPSVSMPQQAEAAGITLVKSKVKGSPTVYRAGPAAKAA